MSDDRKDSDQNDEISGSENRIKPEEQGVDDSAQASHHTRNSEVGDESQETEQAQSKNTDAWTQGDKVTRPQKMKIPNFSAFKRKKVQPLDEENWERDIVNRLAFAALNEQRRARRWGIFFKFLVFLYIAAVLFYIPSDWQSTGLTTGKHTALVELNGVIASNTDASADHIVTGLRAAFKDKNTSAVILRINSPGGSPVQSGYIYDEIKRLRKKHENIKLYAVITDVCASGGYYVAAAADEIYADKASLVGSIGVLMNGFGFVDAMEKLGVERRLLTAGEHKGIMDPFSPLKSDERSHMQKMLDGVHQQFIQVVKEGRGERLQEDPKLFSGLIWNGDESVALGLVDGLASSSYVAREIIGVEKIVDFTPRSNYLDRFADRLGASFAQIMIKAFGLQNQNGQLQ
ncbi:signal peptide peptidase SppA [Kaarinaea lacus]